MNAQSTRSLRRWSFLMLIALLTSVFVLSAPPAFAASMHLVDATKTNSVNPIPSTPFDTQVKTFNHVAGTSVYFSGCVTSACAWAIDDRGVMTVDHTDGTHATQFLESATQPQAAMDVTWMFKVGDNQVTIELYDTYLTQKGSGSLNLYETSTTPTPPPLNFIGNIQNLWKAMHSRFSGNSKDPVDTYTGSFNYTRTDLSITGRGPTPIFVRSYDSQWLYELRTCLVKSVSVYPIPIYS